MKNNKVIVISGFSRGGTNILWNILQSHPEICSVRYETGTIFRKTRHKFSRVISLFQKTGLIETKIGQTVLDYQFYRYKRSNYKHPFNKYKFENVKYTKQEVIDSALCFKSTNMDINYTEVLRRMYPDLYLIALTRNGYAVAEGHKRRGRSIDSFADLYCDVADQMQYYSKTLKHFKLVRFEDMLNDPFKIARELFEFLDCKPFELEKLRLKSKKVITKTGNHTTNFGEENEKYWFDRTNITDLIKPNVNSNQIKKLLPEEIILFNNKVTEAMEYFGYDVIVPTK